jgi:hypothetical protein
MTARTVRSGTRLTVAAPPTPAFLPPATPPATRRSYSRPSASTRMLSVASTRAFLATLAMAVCLTDPTDAAPAAPAPSLTAAASPAATPNRVWMSVANTRTSPADVTWPPRLAVVPSPFITAMSAARPTAAAPSAVPAATPATE